MNVVVLPDDFWGDPRVVMAGTMALGIFIKALSYSVTYNTGGYVSKSAIEFLASDANHYAPIDDADIALSNKLVDCELFVLADGGYLIKDFDEYLTNDNRSI